MKIRPWRARRWGIVFTSSIPTSLGAALIGEAWHDGYRRRCPLIDGETPRALVFHTRATARHWCAQENAKFAAYPAGHVCRAWHVQPVSVLESVTPMRRRA